MFKSKLHSVTLFCLTRTGDTNVTAYSRSPNLPFSGTPLEVLSKNFNERC